MTAPHDTSVESDHAQVHEDLRRACDLLRTIAHEAPDAISLKDPNGTYLVFNEAASRLTGRSVADVLGRDDTAVYDPASAHVCMESDRRVLTRGEPETGEEELSANGVTRTYLTTRTPHRDAHGSVIGVLGIARDISGRKREETALREREELHRLLAENATDFIRVHDTVGQSVYASPSVDRLYGQTPSSIFEFAHPDDLESCREWWDRVVAGKQEPIDWRIRDRDGAWRWLNTRASIIQYRGTTHVMTICCDVTDGKSAESALRESERKLAEAERVAHVGWWDCDLDSGAITWSDETGRIVGEPSDFWSIDEARTLVHPEDRAISDNARDRMVRGESDFVADFRVIRPDGVVRFLHTAFVENGQRANGSRHAFGVVQDVTEWERAKAGLQAAEERLRHVVASSPALLYSLLVQDGELGAISWISENVQPMLGYRPEEAIGVQWWLSNVHPDEREAVVSTLRPVMVSTDSPGGSTDSLAAEYRFRHKDGRYRWVRGENRVLRDAAGNATEVVGSIWDITERKQLEDQFRQAQKMEAVGLLAGGVAHDFNNLLTIIAGYSELLLLDFASTDPRRKFVSEIREAGERAAGLTRQLLAFSRRTVLEPQVLDLNDVVRENKKMLRRLIGEDVQLTAVLDGEIAAVKADPGQIGQVIMNLAVNARDAMPTGGKLTIQTANVELSAASVEALAHDGKPGRYVMLAVSDTGTGITPEVRANLFEPFFTTKGPGKGTGLGLATVYGIVKQTGGFISVESEPGQGTTFQLYFPVMEDVEPASSQLAGVSETAGGTETILVVEDEEPVRHMIRLALHDAGYTVVQASSGAEALRLAEQHAGPIHLLVTDVVMPEMGGRQVVERLTMARPDLRVLYVSGYTEDAVVRHGVSRSEVAFLQKPFSLSALTSKVRQVLDAGPA